MSLSNDDFRAAASFLGCEAAAIKAVAEVETKGNGFLADGRPDILFEAHTFHQLTNGEFDASHPSISSSVWDRTLYGKGGVHQWERLAEAAALNSSAALKSASWGAFQLMGSNYQECGYSTVEAFVAGMSLDEQHHLTAFCCFIKSNPAMLSALRLRSWMDFARRYNGPGFAANSYDAKLAQAYTSANEEA